MDITKQQKTIIYTTYQDIALYSEQVGELFYERLFTMRPNLRDLFTRGSREQGQQFMRMLGVLAAGLNMGEDIKPPLRELGERHHDYGVTPADYEAMGEALLWTLNEFFGAQLSPEIHEAWLSTYRWMVGVMQGAASAN